MWCQIWRFQLRNTIKFKRKKKKNFKEAATMFFKTMFFFCFFLWSFDVVFYMFRSTNQTFHKKKIAGITLEKEMWCQIMQFPLGNTLKLSGNKKKKIKESKTVFFKTTLVFFYVGFYIGSHMLGFIYQTFHQNKKMQLG